jgi:arsenical pump membrane protein
MVVTLTVFAGMLALVVVRPRRWNEAWWTMLGAAAMVVLGLVSPREAISATVAGKNALLFLLSLLALSLLVGKSGFFDWAAIRCARIAKGNAHSLYRNAFVLGAIVTAIFSLDTTAVMLTPVMLAIVKRLKLPAAPYVVLCAFVANVGSLVLPVSNLTNILFADAFHMTFGAFAARMIAPQLMALITSYALLRWHFRRELPNHFDGESLPDPASMVPNRAYFLVCVTVLVVVLAGYFLAPLVGLEPYVIAFAGSGVLVIAGAATGRVQVRAPGELFAAAGATAFASNIMNNLPAALIARSVLLASHAHTGTVLASLVGADVGPMITPFGSLATMLVLALARREGEEVRAGKFVMLGLWATPVIVVATALALTVGLVLAR